ncbi:MAG: flagellar basal body P-ring formation protein FlgA [Alphaproteobacteria bacterium]|nr:flagellar basal body P-ring formation protein FlgA [Alphaproteobacteria bacterium]
MYRFILALTLAFGAVFGLASAYAADSSVAAPVTLAAPAAEAAAVSAAAAPAQIPAAYALSAKDTEEVVAEALVKAGAAAHVQATILGGRGQKLYESARPLAAELRTLTFDKSTMRWTANLLVTSGSEVLTAMPIGGRWQEMVSLPALRHAMRSGDAIGEQDISMQNFPASYSRPGVITDAAALAGKTPRSLITADRPVREVEISLPVLVKRNALVSMHFRAGNIVITATGQALADAAKGEVIEVRNVNSKSVVRAAVQDAENVTVTPPGEGKQYAGN